MLRRSYLTSIIGFLVGIIVYLFIKASTILVFLFGGIGYVIGMILDNKDVKYQLDTIHFSAIPTTQEIFYPDDIPEALILYSPKENLTTALIDFRVDVKPQDFRLSVLKNFQDFEFRVIEDTKKTMFSLSLEFPNSNYPSLLLNNATHDIHFDIKERGCDFKEAIQKIIPGIVLTELQCPDIFGNEQLDLRDPNSFKSPFSSNSSFDSNDQKYPRTSYSNTNSIQNNTDRKHSPDPSRYDKKSVFNELIDYPPIPDTDETDQELLVSSDSLDDLKNKPQDSVISSNNSIKHDAEEAVEESEIIDDLLNSSKSETELPIVPKVFNLTTEKAEQLIGVNNHNFDKFLNNTLNKQPNSNNHESGLLTADKIVTMANVIPTYSDPEKHEEKITNRDDLIDNNNLPKSKDIKNDSVKENSSEYEKLKSDDEDNEEDFEKENEIKFDFSSISDSNNTTESDNAIDGFNNTILGKINVMIKEKRDKKIIKEELKNIRKGLYPNSIQSQET